MDLVFNAMLLLVVLLTKTAGELVLTSAVPLLTANNVTIQVPLAQSVPEPRFQAQTPYLVSTVALPCQTA